EPLSHMLSQRGFRVLRYDQFGRGLSDRPSMTYDSALYTRQLEELTRHLGIERMHLVSWSMGGIIASHYALAAPNRVASLGAVPNCLGVLPLPQRGAHVAYSCSSSCSSSSS